jgi:hypothetical protein
MRRFDQYALGVRPEEIQPLGAVGGTRPDFDAVRNQLLSVAAQGLEP